MLASASTTMNSSPPSRPIRSVCAQVRLRDLGEDLLRHLVAGGVAEAVVDRLEMVEVDQQHADRPVARDLLLQQRLGV